MVASSTDLAGLGMATQLANYAGTAVAAVTAAGTTQGAATVLLTGQTGVTLTTASSQDSVRLPSNAPLWREYVLYTLSSTTANVFPPSGEDINAAGADTAVTIATKLARKFIKVSATHWVSFLAA